MTRWQCAGALDPGHGGRKAHWGVCQLCPSGGTALVWRLPGGLMVRRAAYLDRSCCDMWLVLLVCLPCARGMPLGFSEDCAAFLLTAEPAHHCCALALAWRYIRGHLWLWRSCLDGQGDTPIAIPFPPSSAQWLPISFLCHLCLFSCLFWHFWWEPGFLRHHQDRANVAHPRMGGWASLPRRTQKHLHFISFFSLAVFRPGTSQPLRLPQDAWLF